MGRPPYTRDIEYYNPMAGENEPESPLKKYQYLLPSSSHFINSLSQHLFLVNVNILFAGINPDHLRLTVGRTTDRAYNPESGATEQRSLFYAALIQLTTTTEDPESHDNGNPIRVLVKGPAVPYFARPTPEAKETNNSYAKMSFSSAARHDPDEDKEVREAKEKAISLLMIKLEETVHRTISSEEGLEIWDAKGWKYAEPRPDGVKSGNTRGSSASGWFKS